MLPRSAGLVEERDEQRPQQPLEAQSFFRAAQLVSSGNVHVPSTDDRLRLYALYSVVIKGTPPDRPPSQWIDPTGYSKWTAWSSAAHLSRTDAMAEYIARVQQYSTQFSSSDHSGNTTSDPSLSFGSKAVTGFSIGPTPDGSKHDGDNTEDISSCAADGALNKVLDLLSKDKTLINWHDEEGLTPLMRAADRNAHNVVEALLKKGANVALTDNDGLTALHYAALCGHPQSASLLVQHGASPFSRASDGLSPMDVADDLTKEAMRRPEKLTLFHSATAILRPRIFTKNIAACTILVVIIAGFLAWIIPK